MVVPNHNMVAPISNVELIYLQVLPRLILNQYKKKKKFRTPGNKK